MNRGEYAIMHRVEETHWWYRGLRGMLREFLRALPDDARMLDAGCGTGANLRELGLACGIDYSFEAIRLCRERGLNVTAVASMIDLPFANAAFDAVISCDVLCHQSIDDKVAALEELARVLAPGGFVLLNLPAYQWLLSSHDAHVGTDRRFRKSELKEMLDRAGLVPVRATYWNTALFPLAVCVRLWRKIRPPRASDLASGSGESVTPLFNAVLAAERALAKRAPLPFGLSLMILARKQKR